jgi:Tfp pilus assembly major pilin PilA
MNETNNSWLAASGTTGTTIASTNVDYSGLTLSGNSTINYSHLNLTHINHMRTQQVHVAVFTVERNDKNEINSTKFVKELWVEQKNGTSLDLLVAKQLDKEFDPETTVVRVLYTVTF